MTQERTVFVDAAALQRWSEEVLVAAGARPDDARVVAQSLVDADLRGLDSHGVPARLPNYVARMRAGGIRTATAVTTITDDGAVVSLDAGSGFGQVAAREAMTIALERARRGSVALVGVRNANHLGALGYWTRMAARAGLIGFALSGARARIAPWGSARPLLSTNPWSIAFPVDGQRPPLVVDVSAGVVLSGALADAAAAGVEIPLGWALDADGRPTRDPGAAMAGSMLPFGGAKGGALTLALEVLVTALVGGDASSQVPDLDDVAEPQRLGQLFMALRTDRLVEATAFRDRLAELLDSVEAAPTAVGVDEVRVPGARGERILALRRARGIPLGRIDDLAQLAEQLAVPPPWATA